MHSRGRWRDFILNSNMDRNPAKCVKKRCNGFLPPPPPTALIRTQAALSRSFRGALAREECITVIQPGGGRGVDEFFCIWDCKWGFHLCSVPEPGEGAIAQMFDARRGWKVTSWSVIDKESGKFCPAEDLPCYERDWCWWWKGLQEVVIHLHFWSHGGRSDFHPAFKNL